MHNLLQFLDSTARLAGALALDYQSKQADMKIEAKGPLDFVTAADKAVERAAIEAIRVLYPGDAILGEESGSHDGGTDRLWVIDPIDGTSNYMRGFPWWSVSIGLLEEGRPCAGIVHSPAMGVTMMTLAGQGVLLNHEPFVFDVTRAASGPLVVMTGLSPNLAAEGKAEMLSAFIRTELGGLERKLGCGTASLLHVLLGNADLYLGLGEKIWDVCAAAIIADELGLGHSIKWGKTVDPQAFNFACGSPHLVDRVASGLGMG